MESFVHRLFKSLIAGDGSEMMVHHDLDKTVLPQAQYPVIFSEENTVVQFEHELIDIDRPPEKDIFMVGSVNTEERFSSYAMPVVIESDAGPEWNIDTHESMVQMTTIVRVSMITGNEVPAQAYAQLRFMQLFAQQVLRNPPTQNWQEWPSTLVGFTTVFGLPLENLAGFAEELIYGKWFGATFREAFVPSEHIAIRRI